MATNLRMSLSVSDDTLLLFGTNCRINPFVFSLVGLSQGDFGCAKKISVFNSCSIAGPSENSVPWSKVTLRTGNLDCFSSCTTAFRTVPLSLLGTFMHSNIRLCRSTKVTRQSFSPLPRTVSPSQCPSSDRRVAASGRNVIDFWKQSLLGSLFLPCFRYFIRKKCRKVSRSSPFSSAR